MIHSQSISLYIQQNINLLEIENRIILMYKKYNRSIKDRLKSLKF
jgi:hypothetical protein